MKNISWVMEDEFHAALTHLRNSMGTRSFKSLLTLAVLDFAKRRLDQARDMKKSVKPGKGMTREQLNSFFDVVIAKYAPLEPFFSMFPDEAYEGLNLTVQHDSEVE